MFQARGEERKKADLSAGGARKSQPPAPGAASQLPGATRVPCARGEGTVWAQARLRPGSSPQGPPRGEEPLPTRVPWATAGAGVPSFPETAARVSATATRRNSPWRPRPPASRAWTPPGLAASPRGLSAEPRCAPQPLSWGPYSQHQQQEDILTRLIHSCRSNFSSKTTSFCLSHKQAD